MTDTPKRTPKSAALRAFRRTGRGPADCVVVFQCFLDPQDETWDVQYLSKSWVDYDGDGLPDGVPYAVAKALVGESVTRNMGQVAGKVATDVGANLMDEILNRIRGRGR